MANVPPPGQSGASEPTDTTHERRTRETTPVCPPQFAELPATRTEFDYIVVGSGAGGGPLAARLAEAGKKVLLLEAGDCVANRNYLIPSFHPQSTEDPSLAWHYFVKHYDQPRGDDSNDSDPGPGQRILYPRGGSVGGSTAVNAMISVLPHPDDLGWTITKMEKYYRRVVSWLNVRTPNPTILLGAGGNPLGEADVKLLTAIVGAAAALGRHDFFRGSAPLAFGEEMRNLLNLLLSANVNDEKLRNPTVEGVFSFPLATTERGARNGARERIIQAATAANSNLTVKTNALVTRVLFEHRGDDLVLYVRDEQSGTLREADPTNEDEIRRAKPRAIGVEFLDGPRLYKAHIGPTNDPTTAKKLVITAKREVILAAGAFNTPQLLLLSGIGPAEELKRFPAIAQVAVSEGVGRNLQDRYEVGVVHEIQRRTIKVPNPLFNPFIPFFGPRFIDVPAPVPFGIDYRLLGPCAFTGTDDDECAQRWLRREGVYTTNGSIASVLKRSEVGRDKPDLHIFGLPGVFRGYHPGYAAQSVADKHHFSWVVLKGYNENRAGRVVLATDKPWDRPDINFHSFYEGKDGDGAEDGAHHRDRRAVVQGIRWVRDAIDRQNEKLVPLGVEMVETWPGRSKTSDDDLNTWVEQEAWGHHACCTAARGDDGGSGAVLDEHYRVRAVEGLRVVDASVFARIPGTFIVMSVYMISEEAADVILSDEMPRR
jgi:choline dehydrogenase